MIRLQSTAWPESVSNLDLERLVAAAAGSVTDIASRIAFAPAAAAEIGALTRETAGRNFAGLGALAAVEVTLARVVEPHLDARSILEQAGVEPSAVSTWGVFAAEAPGRRLEATEHEDGWRLTGTKPWCSLASRLSDALVTAFVGPQERRLFSVPLTDPGVTTHDDTWHARGLPLVPSAAVDFDQVRASPIGDPGWYLRRVGFAWGGIGVAACWWGGATGLVERLRATTRTRPDAELLLRTLGAATIDLASAENAVAEAARAIEAGHAEGTAGPRLAQRVRSTVRGRVDAIRSGVVAALGPAPLTGEPDYLARVSDLELYLQQDHGDRDLVRYGRMVLEGE